jgi:hypothetical protein
MTAIGGGWGASPAWRSTREGQAQQILPTLPAISVPNTRTRTTPEEDRP